MPSTAIVRKGHQGDTAKSNGLPPNTLKFTITSWAVDRVVSRDN